MFVHVFNVELWKNMDLENIKFEKLRGKRKIVC